MANQLQPIPDGTALETLWGEDSEAQPTDNQSNLKRTLVIAGGLLGILFLLSLLVPIGGAVIATGQVGVEGRTKTIAHPTGGVIATIAVENGQHVDEGELLMRLEDTVSGAAADYSAMTVEQLLAQRARLEAERLGSGRILFPPELTAAGTDTAANAMADERKLFQIRRAEEGQLRAQLGARISQYEQQIGGFRAQIASLEKQRTLIEPELEGVRELWEQQLVTINRLNELERTAASIEGSIASLQANIASTGARITESREQLIQLGQSRRADAATQLAALNTSLNDQQVRSVSATDQQENRDIRAPYAGVVEKIAFASIGDVVQPAEPIMEIVPDNELMIVEAAISPADIDQVRKGQKARVRFSSFSVTTTPEIDGEVTYVATDRSVDEATGFPYYTARILVDQAQVRREGLDLRSGMPAECYIATGDRPLISFLTKPLRDQFARAFRQN